MWANSNHIKYADKTIATRDIKVVIIEIDINTSSNDYTCVNRGIKRTTTNFEYNKKSAIDRANYSIKCSATRATLDF